MSAEAILARLEQIVTRLEAVEAKIGGGEGGAAAAPAAAGETSAAAQGWDDLIASSWAPFAATTDKIGGDNLKAQVAQISNINSEIRKFINTAATCKKPAPEKLQGALGALAGSLKQVKELRESNRRDKQWEHLSTLSEAVSFCNWIMVEPTPGPYVKESLDASLFWSNKILKQFKGNDDDQVAWCNQLKEFFTEMQAYIKKFHTTGLSWNPRGGEFSGLEGGAAPAAPAGGAPPPPPPGGAPPPPAADAAPAKAGPDTNALFAALNAGGAITSGLKKVTKDMQTHKNPELRAGGVVKSVPKKEVKAAPKFGGAAKKRDPKGPVLEGNKWVIEFHEDNSNIVLPADRIEPKHTVYLYKCEKCTVQIPAKVNSIVMDSCKRIGIVFQDVISGCEVVNSQSLNIQSQGKIANFAVDKASSVQIILCEASIDAQIVTSKCDSINIMFPKDGDFTELPIPEQFITTVKGGKLDTVTMEHE